VWLHLSALPRQSSIRCWTGPGWSVASQCYLESPALHSTEEIDRRSLLFCPRKQAAERCATVPSCPVRNSARHGSY
jgi:hypothetical protein